MGNDTVIFLIGTCVTVCVLVCVWLLTKILQANDFNEMEKNHDSDLFLKPEKSQEKHDE